MNKMAVSFEKVITDKDIDELKKIIIYQENDGSYNIYDKYSIMKNSEGIYVVYVLGTYTEKNFYKLKNAVAWCSFDRRTLYKKAKRLHQLDQMIFSMDTEIQLHSKLVKKTKETENMLIYLAKLTENKAKKRMYNDEISYYIKEYQNWQDKLYNTKPTY